MIERKRTFRARAGDDTRPVGALLLLGVAAFLFSGAGTAAGSPASCTYYAAPAGNGNGRSSERPFSVAEFWPMARAGDTLCLEDGNYRGAKAMLSPPPDLSGRINQPITVRALNDGKVLLDGEGKNLPVRLSKNDWFTIEGVNACCSGGTVVSISKSSHCTIRRVTAWDAAEGNYNIFGIHYGDHNLLEDVAGWGIARKTYESSQGGNFTTIRRAWGRWEGSHVVGPKMVYTLGYNNYNMLVENCVGTWSSEKMTTSYVLGDYYGKPWTGRDAGFHESRNVNQPYAIFGVDALKDDKNARTRLLGSIAYIRASDSFQPRHLVYVTKVDSFEVADVVAYIEPGSHASVKTFGLYGLTNSTSRSSAVNLSAHNLTSYGGAGVLIGKDWEARDLLEGVRPRIGDARRSGRTRAGAEICHRYVDGVLTDQPLWPWPMNQRIIDATARSGRQPVDVTATVENLFGAIPQECRGVSMEQRPPRSPLSRPRTGSKMEFRRSPSTRQTPS